MGHLPLQRTIAPKYYVPWVEETRWLSRDYYCSLISLNKSHKIFKHLQTLAVKMDTLYNYHPWEHREEGAVVWVFVDLVCFFEKGSHIAQVSFELAGWLKTTLNFDLSVWSLWWRFISSHLVHIVVETTPRAFCTQANTLPPPPESVLVCLYIIIWGRVSLQPWFRTSLYSIQSFTHRVVSKWSSNKVSYTLASLNWLFLSRILVRKNFFWGGA